MIARPTAALSVLLLMAAFFAVPAVATEPLDTHDVLLNCVDDVLIVFVGDHEVGKASFTQDQDDSTWQSIELQSNANNEFALIPGTKRVDLWITLDGLEVDPWTICITTTTTSSPTSSTSTTTVPVTSTTSTTITVPVVETTTTTSTSPSTTSTSQVPPPTTVAQSTTTTVANTMTTLPDTGVSDGTLTIAAMGIIGVIVGITLLALVRRETA